MAVNAALTDRNPAETGYDGRCLDCNCCWQGMPGQVSCPECESSHVNASAVLEFLDLGPGIIAHGSTVADYYSGECLDCGCRWEGCEGTACPDCEGEHTQCQPENGPGPGVTYPGRSWPGHDR